MPELHPSVRHINTPDGAVLLHTKTRQFWELNHTAAFVLTTILDNHTQTSATNALATRYGVDSHRVSKDVADLLSILTREGLIRP